MNNCQTVRYLPVFPMSDLNNKLSLNKKCPSVDPKISSSKEGRDFCCFVHSISSTWYTGGLNIWMTDIKTKQNFRNRDVKW